MGLGITLYIIATLILFIFNLISNIFLLSLNDKKSFPIALFLATLFAIGFIIWGTILLFIN